VNVSGAGRIKDPGSVALEGRADLSGVSVASPTMPKPLEGVSGSVEFARQLAAVHHLSGHSGKSSFAFDGTLTRPLAVLAKAGSTPPSALRFRFESPYFDAGEVLPAGRGGVIPLNATGGGTVHIGRYLNKKLDLTNLNAEVAVQPNH